MQMTTLWIKDYQARDFDDQGGCQLAEKTCKLLFYELLHLIPWTIDDLDSDESIDIFKWFRHRLKNFLMYLIFANTLHSGGGF